MAQQFKTTDVLRLEVEADTTGLKNLIRNPNGDLGGWGWVTPVANTAISSAKINGSQRMQFLNTVTQAAYFVSENASVTAGQYVGARIGHVSPISDATPRQTIRLRLEFLDASRTVIAQGAQSAATGLGVVTAPTAQAPTGTTAVRVRADVYTDAGQPMNANAFVYFNNATMVAGATSAAVSSTPYIPPITYTNILGPTNTITIDRADLNLGTLSAVVYDATLDPSQSTAVRPGRQVRVTALNPDDSTEWLPLFVGKISNASVDYDLSQPKASNRAKITLTAVDNVAALANVSRPNGVGTVTELRALLEGAGVPWSVNGSGNQLLTAATTVANNINASLLDQIAITRDTRLGYAWVDRRGVASVVDSAGRSTTVQATITESVYSGMARDYDTDRCINDVTVKLLRPNLATGETVEVPYGPYRDQSSFDLWGAHSVTLTVQGLADTEAAISTYAASILAANATPRVLTESVTFPITTAAHLSVAAGSKRAMIDLYDRVTVSNSAAGSASFSDDLRVTGVKHLISPEKWLTTLTFSSPSGVATPTVAPEVASKPTLTDTPWTDIGLTPGHWQAYPGEEAPGYRRVNGIVYWKGLIQRIGAGGAGVGFFAAAVPAGFRPRVTGSNGWAQQSVGVNGTFQSLYLCNDGQFYLPAANPGAGGYVFLNDIRPYPADA